MCKQFRKYPSTIKASQYVKASEDDIDAFGLPNAYIHRIKKYIVENDPDMLPAKPEDYLDYYDDTEYDYFLTAYDALGQIFNSKQELADYLKSVIETTDDHVIQNYFQRFLDDFLEPVKYDDYEQSSPYVVSGYDPGSGEALFTSLEFDNPESAIHNWVILSQKYPSCVCICAKNDKYAKDLLMWVNNNIDTFTELCEKYNCPYQLEYMLDACKYGETKSKLIDWSGDQVYPFSLG